VRSTVPIHLGESAIDPQERTARLSDRMDAGRSRRSCNGPARSVPRSPLSERVDWQLVGNPTWVPPEQPYPSSFRKHTSASAGPSALWRLPAQLVAGVLGPLPVLERCAGRASLSAVAGAHHDRHRHRPRCAGGRRKSGTPLALAVSTHVTDVGRFALRGSACGPWRATVPRRTAATRPCQASRRLLRFEPRGAGSVLLRTARQCRPQVLRTPQEI